MVKCEICGENFKRVYNINATTKACLKCRRKIKRMGKKWGRKR